MWWVPYGHARCALVTTVYGWLIPQKGTLIKTPMTNGAMVAVFIDIITADCFRCSILNLTNKKVLTIAAKKKSYILYFKISTSLFSPAIIVIGSIQCPVTILPNYVQVGGRLGATREICPKNSLQKNYNGFFIVWHGPPNTCPNVSCSCLI